MTAPAAAPARAAGPAWHAGVLAVMGDLRDLPWRRTRDPWAVLVSEVMLQQTQAARVAGPWQAFVDRFPDPASCAGATAAGVVRAWAGLGYNRRALQLHRAAQVVVEDHGGRVPADIDALLALPGLGPYTARAVVAFAFEGDVAVVDTNVRRVLARSVLGRRACAAELQAVADGLVPRGEGWAWNQCMLELGARWCTGRVPRCGNCPLAAQCTWLAAGHPPPDPGAPATRNAPFAGSDRQGRGRLVAALREGPVPVADTARVAGWPDQPTRALAVVDRLVADGLAVRDGAGRLRLPG